MAVVLMRRAMSSHSFCKNRVTRTPGLPRRHMALPQPWGYKRAVNVSRAGGSIHGKNAWFVAKGRWLEDPLFKC
jgi:hypothetical protein